MRFRKPSRVHDYLLARGARLLLVPSGGRSSHLLKDAASSTDERPRMPADNGELSDAEIDELGDFLDRRIRTAVDDPSESRLGFPFFPFEGFLTGIVSGPDRIPAAEWIPLGIGYVS